MVNPDECNCSNLDSKRLIIWLITVPTIFCELNVLFLCLTNIVKYCRYKGGIPKSLRFCYASNIIGIMSAVAWLSMINQKQAKTYIPYMVTITMKIVFGLAYQGSIIQLQSQI